MESLSARLERMATQKKTVKRVNKAIFLAHKDEIEKALGEGWPIKMIWKALHSEGKYPASYQNFAKYVKEIIYTHREATRTKPSSHRINNAKKENKSSKPQAGFEFNPNFNTKELYGETE